MSLSLTQEDMLVRIVALETTMNLVQDALNKLTSQKQTHQIFVTLQQDIEDIKDSINANTAAITANTNLINTYHP